MQGSFRIAHCGGYHGNLNLLISALNVVAKLLGHEIRWDTGELSQPEWLVIVVHGCHLGQSMAAWLAGTSVGYAWQRV